LKKLVLEMGAGGSTDEEQRGRQVPEIDLLENQLDCLPKQLSREIMAETFRQWAENKDPEKQNQGEHFTEDADKEIRLDEVDRLISVARQLEPDFHAAAREIARNGGGRFLRGPTKTPSRAKKKAEGFEPEFLLVTAGGPEGGGSPRWEALRVSCTKTMWRAKARWVHFAITDLVRCSLVSPSLDGALRLVNAVKARFRVVKLENAFAQGGASCTLVVESDARDVTFEGEKYSDVTMLFELKVVHTRQKLGEVTSNSKGTTSKSTAPSQDDEPKDDPHEEKCETSDIRMNVPPPRSVEAFQWNDTLRAELEAWNPKSDLLKDNS